MKTFKTVSRMWMLLLWCFPIASFGRELYNTNTFQVSSNSDKLLIGEAVFKNSDYFTIRNFGPSKVWAVIQQRRYYLFQSPWDSAATEVGVGTTVQMPIPEKAEMGSRLVIRNKQSLGTIIFAGVDDGYATYRDRNGLSVYLSIDTMALLKSISTFGAGYIPGVGSALSAIIDFFWQVAGPDIWSQVSKKVENMIDEKTLDLVSDLVTSKLRRYRKRISAFDMLFRIGPKDENNTFIINHFLSLAQDMFGLEEEFIFDRHNPKNRKTNYFLLPYYAKVVSLQMDLYNFGIANKDKLRLDETAVNSLYMSKHAILNSPGEGSVDYIRNLYYENKRYVFDDCQDGEEIYNCMANMRTYIVMNGFQYIPFWLQTVESQMHGMKPLSCEPLFSTFLGRPSHGLNEIGTKFNEPKELTPGNSSSHCSRFKRIEVFVCDGVLCGMKTEYDDFTEYVMGTESRNRTEIDVGGRILQSLVVYGTDRIEAIDFHFDDGNFQRAGRARNSMGTFALQDHYIAGILVTNGVKTMNQKALANIAVSYLQDGY